SAASRSARWSTEAAAPAARGGPPAARPGHRRPGHRRPGPGDDGNRGSRPATRARRAHDRAGTAAILAGRSQTARVAAMLEDIKNDAQQRMRKSVESLRHELTRLRTGRASTAIIEPIKVPYYGNDTPISQVANIAVADSR